MLPGGQCRLDRFGFGCFSTVKNPIVHPLPVFGPKGPPPVKKGVGRPKKPQLQCNRFGLVRLLDHH